MRSADPAASPEQRARKDRLVPRPNGLRPSPALAQEILYFVEALCDRSSLLAQPQSFLQPALPSRSRGSRLRAAVAGVVVRRRSTGVPDHGGLHDRRQPHQRRRSLRAAAPDEPAADVSTAPRAHGLAHFMDSHRRRQVLRRHTTTAFSSTKAARASPRSTRPMVTATSRCCASMRTWDASVPQPPLDADRRRPLQQFAEQQPAARRCKRRASQPSSMSTPPGNLVKVARVSELGSVDATSPSCACRAPNSAPCCATTSRPAAEKSSTCDGTGGFRASPGERWLAHARGPTWSAGSRAELGAFL